MPNKIVKVSFFLLLFILVASKSYGVSDPFPHAAKSYVLYIDGELIWAKNPNLVLPPASLTKVMTAIIVLESTRLDNIVSIKKSMDFVKGARINLKIGEKYYVSDLLSAILISSANDACLALAEYIGKTEANFVKIMNKKAKELGLKNTHFKNACGYDSDGHVSTANDLAKLSFYALKYETFAKLVSTKNTTIGTVDGKREIFLKNSNILLDIYEGTYGIKTGYTLKAGESLIASVERKGKKALLVLLNSPNRWKEAVSILDAAFELKH